MLKYLQIFFLSGLIGCQANDDSQRAEFHLRYIKLVNVVNEYYLTCGKYPASLESLLEESNCLAWSKVGDRVIELEDTWGRRFEYHYPPRGERIGIVKYELYSLGRDGKEFTEDDIAN